jgi:DNA-binding XRE family transcriptional regulator
MTPPIGHFPYPSLRSINMPRPAFGHHGPRKRSSVARNEAHFREQSPPDQPAGAISAGGTVLSFYESEFLSQLGERVRTLRALRDMSRRELARQSGISERYIAQIEAGRGNVSIVLLLRLAQAMRSERFATGEGDQWDSSFSLPKSATSHR